MQNQKKGTNIFMFRFKVRHWFEEERQKLRLRAETPSWCKSACRQGSCSAFAAENSPATLATGAGRAPDRRVHAQNERGENALGWREATPADRKSTHRLTDQGGTTNFKIQKYDQVIDEAGGPVPSSPTSQTRVDRVMTWKCFFDTHGT